MSFSELPKDVLCHFLKNYLDPLDFPNILLTASLFHVLCENDSLHIHHRRAIDQEVRHLKLIKRGQLHRGYTWDYIDQYFIQCDSCGAMLRKDKDNLEYHSYVCGIVFPDFEEWKNKKGFH